MLRVIIGVLALTFSVSTLAKEFALTSVDAATALKLKPIYLRNDIGVALIELNDQTRADISRLMHQNGKCGGYELITLKDFRANSAPFRKNEQQQIEDLFKFMPKTTLSSLGNVKLDLPEFSQKIADLTQDISVDRLKADVAWISSYPTRHHQSSNKNAHVDEMKRRLEEIAGTIPYVKVDYFTHDRTQQKSLRATITGSTSPNEIVALGAHFDSINMWKPNQAPGADDDGSGSANLLEIFRILTKQEQPKRTVQFFWYAAEEVGLVGSAEIAQDYKSRNADVVSVMQLDMTLFPGSGAFTLALMTDFTNPWLRTYFAELNRLYTKVKVIEDKCGYGCSDHASWHRQGFPAAIPFESAMSKYNQNIHTEDDVVDTDSNFEHSAVFSRLGLAYVLSMANSNHRAPASN